jgi:peroxiredoxin
MQKLASWLRRGAAVTLLLVSTAAAFVVGVVPPAGAARLGVGAPAPDFAVTDLDGKPLALADLAGKRVLLSFYRYAACVFCNLRTHDVIERAPAWQAKGLAIVAFFQSPPASMKKYVGKQQPPFPLVPDPERKVYARYGVEASGWGMIRGLTRFGDIGRGKELGLLHNDPEGETSLLPAEFLIDAEGRIAEAFYAQDIGDHLPFERIDRFVAAP